MSWLNLDTLVWPTPLAEPIVKSKKRKKRKNKPKLKQHNSDEPETAYLIIDVTQRMPRMAVKLVEGKKMTPEVAQGIACEMVEVALKQDIAIECMLDSFLNERKADLNINRQVWIKHAHNVCGDALALLLNLPLNDNYIVKTSVDTYQDILRTKVINAIILNVTNLHRKQVFEIYPPDANPLVFCCFQPNLNREFPSVGLINSLTKMQHYKLAPSDAMNIKPFPGSKFIAYGMFYSFCFNYNVFIGLFTSNNPPGKTSGDMFKVFQYYYVIFDRYSGYIKTLKARLHDIVVCHYYTIPDEKVDKVDTTNSDGLFCALPDLTN